jgi:Family of unknown function (DUF5519)
VSATREASLVDRVVTEVTSWPAVNASRADCGRGIGLSAGSHQIVHLHETGRVQVRLTRPVIQRMEDALLESGQVDLEERGDWVSVRLASDSDAALLVSLVSVAIKANGAGPPGVARREAPSCPDRAGHRRGRWRKH